MIEKHREVFEDLEYYDRTRIKRWELRKKKRREYKKT